MATVDAPEQPDVGGHFGGSMGACLIANDLPSLGNMMLERRVQGQSWKQIADEFHLGAPGTARKKFANITGITDFKTKGPAIKALAKQTGFLDEAGNVVAKNAAGKITKGLKTAVKPGDTLTKKAIPKGAEGWTGKVDAEQFLDTVDNLTDIYGEEKILDVLDLAQSGKGYTAISQQTGVAIKDIDEIVWSDLLASTDGNVWAAYLKKPTSQSGGNAVKAIIQEGRGLGLSVEQIADITGIPKTVVDAVVKNTWQVPTTAGAKAIIPEPPPPPFFEGTFTSDTPLDAGDFRVRTAAEMNNWNNSIDPLTPQQLSSMRSYTGSGYHGINDGLRGSGRVTDTIKNIDAGMAPIPFDAKVIRNTGGDTYKALGITPQTANQLVGKVVADPGYVSTSLKDVFGGQAYRIEFEVPKGTMSRWVGGGISQHGMSEAELLIGRGAPYIITEVTSVGRKVHIKARFL